MRTKVSIIATFAFLITAAPAYAQLVVKQDGGTVGPVSSVNCIGPGVTCTRSGSTWNLSVDAGTSGGGGLDGTPDTFVHDLPGSTSLVLSSHDTDMLLVFPTADWDTDSAVSTNGTSTWTWTCPESGFYVAEASALFQFGLASTQFTAALELYKNGSAYRTLDWRGGLTRNDGLNIIISGQAPLQLTAGDTLKFYAHQSNGASSTTNVSVNNGARYTWATVRRYR